MLVCILGNTKAKYSWFVLTLLEGLKEKNIKVVCLNYRDYKPPFDKLSKDLMRINPDILFTHLTFHGNPKVVNKVLQIYNDLRKKRNTRIVHMLGDARHEPRYTGDISNAIDFAFVSQTENISKFQKYWKVPTFYWQYPTRTQSQLANPVSELAFKNPVFTGSVPQNTDRTKFINKLQKVMPIHIFETQSGKDLRHRTPELSISAKCILGLCTGYDISHFTDVRPWQYLGSGACMIMRKFKGMDDIIPDNLYYPIMGYTDVDVARTIELYDIIKRTNTRPMREKAFDFMQKFHSPKRRYGDIIDVVQGKRNNVRIFLHEL